MKQILHKTKQILYKTYKFLIIFNIISFILLALLLLKFFNPEIFGNSGKTIAWFSSIYLPLIMIPLFIIHIIFKVNLKTSIAFLIVNILIIYKAIEYLNAHLID